KRGGGRVARLYEGGRGLDEGQQPVALSAVRNALEIRTHFDAFSEGVARCTAFSKNCLGGGVIGTGGGDLRWDDRQESRYRKNASANPLLAGLRFLPYRVVQSYQAPDMPQSVMSASKIPGLAGSDGDFLPASAGSAEPARLRAGSGITNAARLAQP